MLGGSGLQDIKTETGAGHLDYKAIEPFMRFASASRKNRFETTVRNTTNITKEARTSTS